MAARRHGRDVNYLGHLLLADRVGADLAGAVLGDFVRGSDLSALPADIAHSVRLHRRLDAFIDHHPLTRDAVAGFGQGARRYAPILLDVVVDHLLARDWPQYSDTPFSQFCADASLKMEQAGEWFAAQGAGRPQRDQFQWLLESYAAEAGVERALQRIASRLSKPEPLRLIIPGWQAHANELRPRLPELIADLTDTARAFA